MTDIAGWLTEIGLPHLCAAFAEQKVDFDVLLMLDESDLRDLGVTALGDRKRLLKAIGELKRPNLRTDAFVAASAPELPTLLAERRQLTVMFCDLVDSTALATTRDPEEYQTLIHAYHEAVMHAVAPFQGHVARFLGDGVLVYFGYPHAHEDEAGQAVRAGLRVLAAISDLRPSGDVVLRTRIGIATGTVVIGEVGTGTAAAEKSAAGETPNLAARLQTVARPGEMVVSGDTQRLLDASFELEELGRLDLKGFSVPIETWRVLGEHVVASRFEARHTRDIVRFIGRDSEVSLLLERWEMARERDGQVVLLSGEAGIGKSRICLALRDRIGSESITTVQLHCSPYFGSSALYPVVQHLERAAGFAAGDSLDVRRSKFEKMVSTDLSVISLGYLLRLMGLPDGAHVPAEGRAPLQEKMHTLQALTDLLLAHASRSPILFLVEDAHWIDPTTEEFIALLVHRLRDAAILAVVTCRPEYAPTWGNAAHLTRLTLSRLGQRQCAALVEAASGGKPLPQEVLAEIVRKTDGVPLFVEELTRTVIQSGILVDTPSGYRLKAPMLALTIPSTLQDSLMAQLDRLAPAKEVAQVGAAIGREFSHSLVAAVLNMDLAQLQHALDQLVSSGLVSSRQEFGDTTYTFKHALIRDTAYNSMLKTQRVLHHSRIAMAIEKSEPGVVHTQPELLAHHYQVGGNDSVAFKLWSSAGEFAASRSAAREAVTHFRAALHLLPAVEDLGENATEIELRLQMQLGNALVQSEGYAAADTIHCYARARELALTLGQVDRYVTACAGVGSNFWASGQFRAVIDMFDKLTPAEAARLQPMSQVTALTGRGVALHLLGDMHGSWGQLIDAKRVLDRVEHVDQQLLFGAYPAVAILAYASRTRAYQGYLGEASASIDKAYDAAERLAHEPTRAWALQMKAWIEILKGEWADASWHSKQLLALAQRFGFKTRIATGLIALGRANVETGEADPGLQLLNEGISLWATAGGKFHLSEYAALAGDALLRAGRSADALKFITAGEKVQHETEERFFHAELVRLRGRLFEIEGDGELAQERYRQALAIAEQQGAKLFSLRAATDLAELCNRTGRSLEGRTILEPVYGWFSEGFGYPDLVRAKIVLEASTR